MTMMSGKSLALTREVNLATESSAPSTEEMRESEKEFQSLILTGEGMATIFPVLRDSHFSCTRSQFHRCNCLLQILLLFSVSSQVHLEEVF